jgi:lactoylglutathione lyase
MQLALNVDDLEEAVTFYSKLFDTTPTKLKEGYVLSVSRDDEHGV